MQEKLQGDCGEESENEADHPFQNEKICLDLGEAVFMDGQGLGSLARLVVRRAGSDEGVKTSEIMMLIAVSLRVSPSKIWLSPREINQHEPRACRA
jgi:hypothetical protein